MFMNTTETINQLQSLKLRGMTAAYQSQLDLPMDQHLEAHDMVAHLVQAEYHSRNQERTNYYLKLARLRIPATPEQIRCSPARNLHKQDLALLLQGDFIRHGRPVLITGPTGCGKSFLACALAHHACQQGHRTLYQSMTRFIERITMARLEGTYVKLINHLERTPLIILDDFGLQPLDQNIRLTLLQMLEDRYNRKTVIITSQLPVSKWHEYINEPSIADAIMDRLTANPVRIELKGESLRKADPKSDKM